MEGAVVYLNVGGVGEEMWYRVYFEAEGDDKDIRQHISPVAVLQSSEYGRASRRGWAVIDDQDIYVLEGDANVLNFTSMLLLKHNTAHADPTHWETLPSLRKLPRTCPFVTAVGRKIYFVGGQELYCRGRDPIDWTNCGDYYDIDHGTWQYINWPMEPFRRYSPAYVVRVVKEDGTQPTQIVYHVAADSIFFFDVATAKSHTRTGLEALWKRSPLPPGLEGFDAQDIRILDRACANVLPAFCNSTFYWFTDDLRLYGFDIGIVSWFRSPSLRKQFPTLRLLDFPTLVGLPHNKLLLILPDGLGEITMASLSVERVDHSLNVSVEYTRAYSFGSRTSRLLEARAMLKKNGSSSMHG